MKYDRIVEKARWVVERHTLPDFVTVGGVSAVTAAVQPDLLEAFEDRFPYFRFKTERELKPVAV